MLLVKVVGHVSVCYLGVNRSTSPAVPVASTFVSDVIADAVATPVEAEPNAGSENVSVANTVPVADVCANHDSACARTSVDQVNDGVARCVACRGCEDKCHFFELQSENLAQCDIATAIS